LVVKDAVYQRRVSGLITVALRCAKDEASTNS
jgi:hypothetical protein